MTRSRKSGLLGCLAILILVTVTFRTTSAEDAKGRFFEQRIYVANSGKIEALHSRFRDHTNRLFVKHGMELIGYWTPTDGEDADHTLIYILAYPSREARDASWKAFIADPEWQKVHQASEVDGKLVKGIKSTYLTPTDYSPIK